MRKILKPRYIRNIAKTTMVIMWLMSFFAIGRFEIEAITFKQTMQSVVVYMFWFVINFILFISNEK